MGADWIRIEKHWHRLCLTTDRYSFSVEGSFRIWNQRIESRLRMGPWDESQIPNRVLCYSSQQINFLHKLVVLSVDVRSLHWVRVRRLGRPIDGGPYLSTRIILGVVLVWFLVLCVRLPGCSQNDSELCPDLWTQKNCLTWRERPECGPMYN